MVRRLSWLRLNHPVGLWRLAVRRLDTGRHCRLLLLLSRHLTPLLWHLRRLLARSELRCQRWRGALDRLRHEVVVVVGRLCGTRSITRPLLLLLLLLLLLELLWWWGQDSLRGHLAGLVLDLRGHGAGWLGRERFGGHLIGGVGVVRGLAVHCHGRLTRVVVLRLVGLVLADGGLEALIDLLVGWLLHVGHLVDDWWRRWLCHK